jgi:MGT family glycosyltransferase
MSSGGGNIAQDKLPGSPIVVEYAPQIEILSKAALAVTHAGLNTVLESLAAGVPMVAIPVTNDQPAVAARVEASGTGKVIALRSLSAHLLRERIVEVLTQGSYRNRAAVIQNDIRAAGGARRAAEIIERASSLACLPG